MATKKTPPPAVPAPPVPAPEGRTPRSDEKSQQLLLHTRVPSAEGLTTNQGTRLADNHNSLKAGARGPSLLEDFILREKITHFDHERIPERAVHARGAGAHGYFEAYEDLGEWTRASFLAARSRRTPVFVRFSTVAGSRGSADTARDVRGFAVKFYTDEGVFDLVGNNVPVFFIQDAIKFPDLIHAVKPEPHNEIPQAQSAHDTFWDFASLMPESTHMLMWAMSDRAIPRSYRMMEGFGVHTFRLVDAQGESRLAKFHWKPLLGVHGLAWDEAQKLAGKDPDFHRRDLWEAIDQGAFPEWELGLQVFTDEDADRFIAEHGFDILDATKIVPEELVPVKRVGRLVLDRNPDNFFAETEQVAFHPGHVVPGIDFTNDPLLQGRLFSYTDTQLSRLGGPNFHEIPINRPVCPFHHNFQRDGMHRQTLDPGRVAYEPNSLLAGREMRVSHERPDPQGYVSHPEAIAAPKLRVRSETFGEHFRQATLFWNSQAPVEQDHIVAAFAFELSHCETPAVRERMVGNLVRVDALLAARVAYELGLLVRADGSVVPLSAGAPFSPPPTAPVAPADARSPALSMIERQHLPDVPPPTLATRKVACLVADGVDEESLEAVRAALAFHGASLKVLAPRLGTVATEQGGLITVDATIVGLPSVAFDAVFVPGGDASIATLRTNGDALHFVLEAFRHCKAIATADAGVDLLNAAGLGLHADDERTWPAGVVVADSNADLPEAVEAFIDDMKVHRHWQRERRDAVPA